MGTRKVQWLVDKVYKQKNLEIAWERVQANRGSGGVEGKTSSSSRSSSDSNWVACNESCKGRSASCTERSIPADKASIS